MNTSPVLLLLLFLLSICHGKVKDASPASGISATTKAQKKVEKPLEASCPEPSDIQPCECLNQFDLFMDCSKVQDEEQLRKVFSAFFPSTDFYTFYMSQNKGVKVLEDGVFGNVSFQVLDILGSVLESVRNDSLTPSLSTLSTISIQSSQLTIFPFERLTEFTSLKFLFLFSNKIHSLPLLSSSSLQSLDLSYNPISHVSPDVFSLLPAIEHIYLHGCNLTEITPGTFNGLQELFILFLSYNNISYLQSLTFNLISPRSLQGSLHLENNNIDFVEVDAFEGVQEPSTINMKNNDLTTLEEEVWRPVLNKSISVLLEGNALSCGCDVAWLVRDSQLLKVVNDAHCADGTMLADLDPADFDICA